ncbi:23S rRNA (adenine(2503)-C(2))-methyltransferase RlmN [Candidatus Saganbacteria bacterium]|nr:23S rRNA (adenine(2503)-C(2))-methyltransferase RlmN [Candidatus Saganbacteria bacterium]
MEDLLGKDLNEIQAICQELGVAKFKAKEIFRAVNQKLITNLSELTTLKLEERNKLAESFFISTLQPANREKSAETIKALFCLADGKLIETVFMDAREERKTLCLSSQVGCLIGCAFCATGQLGFKRNLTVAEILGQVYYFAREHKISNLVFMGMGEPFLNYDNVLKAIDILNIEIGLNIAARKIVVSTIGIISGIEKFAQASKQLRLAWSLVSPFEQTRQQLIGYAGLPTIQETVAALAKYQSLTKRRITIEYVVLDGINDSIPDAVELGNIAKQLDSHINLIPYNSSPGQKFTRGKVQNMLAYLKNNGLNTTVRQSLGQEISAACGQLAGLPNDSGNQRT